MNFFPGNYFKCVVHMKNIHNYLSIIEVKYDHVYLFILIFLIY